MKNEFERRREELLDGLRADAKMKHTPGPWKISRTSSGLEVITMSYGMTLNIAVCSEYLGLANGLREAKANARLIAAAPELLEALKGLRDVVTDLYKCGRFPAFEFVRAGNVIAKAEGRDG